MMIDVMKVSCPHCKSNFDVDIYIGEESSNHNASLTRRTTQHINWSEISSEINRGYGNAILSVGDSISFALKNGKQASVSVAGINLYGQNSAVFAFDDLMWRCEMNSRNTNRGGWAKSKMADFIEKEVLPLLPDDLVNVISPRTIVQNLGGTRYERTSKLWVPSRTEMFGYTEDYKECDFGDVQFPLFKTEKSRVKALEDGTTEWYWLRSPNVYYTASFWIVGSSGGGSYYGASNTLGVCPCFIIGKQDEEESSKA